MTCVLPGFTELFHDRCPVLIAANAKPTFHLAHPQVRLLGQPLKHAQQSLTALTTAWTKAAVSQQLNLLASNTSLQSAGKNQPQHWNFTASCQSAHECWPKRLLICAIQYIRHVDCDTLDQNQGREYIIYPSYAIAINTHTMFTFTYSYSSCD